MEMNNRTKTSILIADDHVLFNDGIKGMLAGENGFEVIAQVFSGDRLIEQLAIKKPTIILLDINMPGKTGLELVEILAKQYPSIAVIMLSMYSDKRFVQECKRMKVKGYVLKNASKEKLITAIQSVANGETYYDPVLEEHKNKHQDDEFIRKFSLTKRELEIIRLVKENHTAQDIANILFLSVFTVETHRRNINLKLGIKNTVGLINFAAEHGI
ncbi:Oxygen regulatory protein NreC [compost metagenome]